MSVDWRWGRGVGGSGAGLDEREDGRRVYWCRSSWTLVGDESDDRGGEGVRGHRAPPTQGCRGRSGGILVGATR